MYVSLNHAYTFSPYFTILFLPFHSLMIFTHVLLTYFFAFIYPFRIYFTRHFPFSFYRSSRHPCTPRLLLFLFPPLSFSSSSFLPSPLIIKSPYKALSDKNTPLGGGGIFTYYIQAYSYILAFYGS